MKPVGCQEQRDADERERGPSESRRRRKASSVVCRSRDAVPAAAPGHAALAPLRQPGFLPFPPADSETARQVQGGTQAMG